MKVFMGKSDNRLPFKINLSTTTTRKKSRRQLSIDVVIDRDISKNNQTTLYPCFAFLPKTVTGLLATDTSFYLGF